MKDNTPPARQAALPRDRNAARNALVPLFNEQIRTLETLFDREARAQRDALVAIASAFAHCVGRPAFTASLQTVITANPDNSSETAAELLTAILRAVRAS